MSQIQWIKFLENKSIQTYYHIHRNQSFVHTPVIHSSKILFTGIEKMNLLVITCKKAKKTILVIKSISSISMFTLPSWSNRSTNASKVQKCWYSISNNMKKKLGSMSFIIFHWIFSLRIKFLQQCWLMLYFHSRGKHILGMH